MQSATPCPSLSPGHWTNLQSQAPVQPPAASELFVCLIQEGSRPQSLSRKATELGTHWPHKVLGESSGASDPSPGCELMGHLCALLAGSADWLPTPLTWPPGPAPAAEVGAPPTHPAWHPLPPILSAERPLPLVWLLSIAPSCCLPTTERNDRHGDLRTPRGPGNTHAHGTAGHKTLQPVFAGGGVGGEPAGQNQHKGFA